MNRILSWICLIMGWLLQFKADECLWWEWVAVVFFGAAIVFFVLQIREDRK